MGGKIQGPAFNDVAEKVDWVERFVLLGTQATEAARSERERYFPGHALDGHYSHVLSRCAARLPSSHRIARRSLCKCSLAT